MIYSASFMSSRINGPLLSRWDHDSDTRWVRWDTAKDVHLSCDKAVQVICGPWVEQGALVSRLRMGTRCSASSESTCMIASVSLDLAGQRRSENKDKVKT